MQILKERTLVSATAETEPILVFRRTAIARAISLAAALGACGLLIDYLTLEASERTIGGTIGLAALASGTVLAALVQYGDRIYLSADGVVYMNRFLPRFGRGNRSIRWEEVVEIREIRRKVLVLFSRDARRMVVDAIAGYPIARREILRRLPQRAVISGTLRKEDRE